MLKRANVFALKIINIPIGYTVAVLLASTVLYAPFAVFNAVVIWDLWDRGLDIPTAIMSSIGTILQIAWVSSCSLLVVQLGKKLIGFAMKNNRI